MKRHPVGIAIAGSSHAGKSTLARRLRDAVHGKLISTDDLGRHPGRPWPTVRPQVAEYYARLSDDTIHWFLKVHHENMWPQIVQTMRPPHQLARPIVLEGAALRPEYIAAFNKDFLMFFLYADGSFLRARMEQESRIKEVDLSTAAIFEKFIERSLRENDEMFKAAQIANIRCVDVADPAALELLEHEIRSQYDN